MSAPAAKARWEPVSMMEEIVGEASKDWRAVLSSVMRGVLRALSALGRLSVTRIVLIPFFRNRDFMKVTDSVQHLVVARKFR